MGVKRNKAYAHLFDDGANLTALTASKQLFRFVRICFRDRR